MMRGVLMNVGNAPREIGVTFNFSPVHIWNKETSLSLVFFVESLGVGVQKI